MSLSCAPKIARLSKEENTMKHNPDDRRDNVQRIQANISDTIKNIHLADEMIEKINKFLADKVQ